MDTNVNFQGGCSATMELIPGDKVYVSCGNVEVVSGASRLSGLSGFLIQPYL